MATKKYNLSELGEIGSFLKSVEEKNKSNGETRESETASSSTKIHENLGSDLVNFLKDSEKKYGRITKKDYTTALENQRNEIQRAFEARHQQEQERINQSIRDRIGAAAQYQVNAKTTPLIHDAPNQYLHVSKANLPKTFAMSEKEEADKRAARQKSIENAKQNHPVVTDINPVSDWLNYIFDSEQNYGRGGIENAAYSVNAFGAGTLEAIKNAAKAISGDKEAQDIIKNDAKYTKDKIVAAFEKNRENPYGTPDEQLQEGEHLENLKKVWNKINPISNAAKAASVFNSTPYNKGFAEYKNTHTPEYQKDVIQKEIERTHAIQSAKPQYSPTQIIKGLLTNTAYNMPAIAVSVASRGTAAAPYANYISGATLGIQSMSDSYDEAKKEGATDEEAVQYAMLEGVNQGVMDTVLGGVSGATGGFLDKPISNLASHIVRTPLAKTMVETGFDMLEEGMQESAQNYITTINKRVTYNPDAEFDVEGAVYEGVLGGLNSLVLSPGKAYSRYQVNKSSYDTVNSLSIAANKVSSEQDAKVISDIANQISKGADEVIADSKTETADKANAEYIKRGAEAVKKKLNENSANIIKNNQSVLEKTQEIIRTHKTSDAESLSELVNAVKESGYGGNSNNAVNNTVDYVNELITEQNQVAKTAESIASMQDSQISEDAQTAAVQKQKANEALEYTNTVIPQLKSISENLRSKRSEINARLKLDENTETMTNQNVKQEVNTQTTATDTSASATAEAQQAKATTTERVSNSAYHSETAENIRSTYEGRNIKETAENIIKAHGNVRSAVDYVHDVYAKSGGSNADASTKEYIRALDSEIRKANKPLLEKNIKRVETLLKEYGVKNVEIDESITPLTDDGKSVWGMAHYNRGTGRIYVSPYADGKAIIGSKIVHEFTHHAAKADNSLVSDILKAASESKVFNKEIKLADGTTTTTIDNLTRLVKENYADEINEYIATSTNLSRYKVLVGMGKSEADAARIVADEFKASHAEEYNSIVDEYVNEDTAAYVMEFLNQEKNEDILSQLIKDNRPLWKRILDKIEDFIAKITGKTEAREYQKAADKIREILGNEIDAKVENTGSFKAIQQQIKNGNSKIGNSSEGRKFSMELNVDESNGLFAIHNLTADSFMKSYELGGFAMPSIAIARSDVGHSNFGDISLVFASDTINPANSDNKVYSADAWTPTFPKIEYEANSKVTDKLRDKYYELYGKFGHEKISALYPYGNYFEEQLNTDGGVDGIISKQSNNPQMMQVYLADTQGKTVDSVVKETKTTLPSEQVEQSEFIIDKLGADTVNEMRPQANESPISARKRWMSEHGDAFKAAYTDYLMQSGLTSEEAQNAIDNMTKAQLLSQMVKTRNYLANGAETVKSEVDTEATNNAIKEAVNQEDYLKWLHSLFDGGEKKSGVSNGKEPYTRNGNRRPFSATHYPVTLDNIVLSMKSQGDGNAKNATSIFVGSKTIRAESAAEYSSLDEIRADKGRLAHRTPEEAKAAWDEFDNRLSAIINRIMDAESGIDNRFIEQDRIGSVLAEASRNNTEANIKKVLTQYKLTPAVAADFKALVDDIKSAPVDIFEAKPERVVGLDEIKYAIVPSDINSNVTTALNNAGIETKTYENGNEADRLKVLNTLSDVRFSKQLDTENNTPVAQSISSWKTSIKQVPALFRNPNVKFGETNIDIGGGRFDLATDFLRENGTKNMLFDPYNRSEEVNKATLDYLRDGNRADTATCANVLNVIKEADARANVILETAKSIKQDGTAYFMVYEGDGSGTGKETSSGWQNNKKTADYVSEIEQYFNIVDRKGKLITATDPKENLPKAAWELSPGNAVRYSKNLTKYDYSKSFSEQIEDYKNGIIPKYDTLVVGKTPEVFTKIGLNPLPMTYGTGHLSDILKGNVQDHDFGEANLKQIPKALESPVAIFASSTRPDSSVVAILDLSYNNKPMFAAVEIDGTGKLNGENIDSNAITTLHTRQNAANMLNKALAKESNGDVSVYYLDKNKATRFLRSSGVQFPGVMSITDGYVHSIRDSGSPVNIKIENVTKTQQFKRWFGDWENHPKAASKVVNTDGTPKVVYHGTNADFWTFSLANRGKNGEKLGVGYYFVDNKSSAERYGDRVIEAYLDIKKPASAEVMEISRKDWEKFLDFAIEHRDEYIDGEWKGNEINKEYELTDYDYGSNDAELIKGFLNGIAAGNKDVTEAYLEMLKDSTGYDGIAYNTDNTDYYVAFTPEQIKSATDNIGTFDKDNKDIRYSKELMTAEEKKKVREAERAAYLERQLVSTAPLGGKAKAVSPTAKAAVAKKIASGMPGVSTAQVNEQLTKFFEVIEHPKATTPAAYRDEVRQMANVTAQNLYNEFRIENTNPLYDEFNDAYNHIKSLKFKMTDAVKDDFGKEAYSDFYKRARGTLKLRVNDGMAVDELWSDLCNLYPYFFNESTTNPSEMMEQIYEVQSSLKKTPGHPYYDMRSENTDIFSEGEDTATVNSIADALVAAYLENAKPTVAAENKSLRNENKRLAEEANAARGEAADAKTTLKVAMDWNQAELTKMYGDFTRQISEEQKQLQQANRKIERLTSKLANTPGMKEVKRINVNMAQKVTLKEIGRLHEMFTNPTKQKHIPQNLRMAVGSYLTSLNNTMLLNGKTVNSQEITEILQSEREKINNEAAKVINTLSGKFTTDSELFRGASSRQIEALKFQLDRLIEVASNYQYSETFNEPGPTNDFIFNLHKEGANVNYDELNEAYNYIKSHNIKITDAVKKYFEGDTYQDFYKNARGKLHLRVNDGVDIMTMWKDLSSSHPNIFDAELKNPSVMLEQMLEVVSSVRIVNVSNNVEYIKAVGDLTRMVNYLVKQSNDFFTGTRKVEAETFAKSWIDELSGHKTRIGETGFERSQFKKLLDGVGYSFMSADLFFSTMGEPGKEISSWYRNAQTRQVKMKQEYGEYMSELLGDNYSTIAGSTQAKKNLIDVKIHGNDVKVSKNQLMSLYLTWKRAAGRRHLENGGAAFTNANNETSKVYVIDEATYNTLMEKLTADDKRIADGIGKFLSENCSEWGNEASMQLYGIRLYEDSNYFPIRTPSELRDTNFSNLADTHTIENSSFTHKLNKNANAAVVIGDVFDIADRHVNDMSAYSAYAPLNNSMERAFNANGLKRALSSAYGNNGVKYMQDFIDKINGNEPKRTTGENANKVLNFFSNNAKKAAVSANISTALKQPLSLVRSWLVIDPKYTLAAYAQITPGVNNIVKQGKEYNRILNTMNEYSGIAVIKSLGYSDTGIGTTTRETYDEQSLKSAYNKAKYIKQSAEDIAMRPAEFADEITWVRMWKACELEAKAKYGNTLSTDEFNRHVADKFNEIIGKTQVVDSVLDTAPISTNRLFKTLYPFMNEPVKTAATLISAAENVRNGKSGAKKQLTNAIGCYVISNLLLEPIVSSLIGMWRHDSPKDPEDFAKKFLERFIGIQADGETKWTDIFSSNVADGLFAVPYIAQIYDTIANKFNNFDPERMDLQPVADLVGNGMYFFNSLSKEDYENQKTKANYAADMIASLAQILGIPGSTLKRDLSAIARTAVDATGAYVAQWELNKVYYNLGNANARTNKNFYDIMAKAYNAGDTEAYSYMLRDLRSIQTGAKAFGVPYSNINKYITEHGAKIVEGTDMWYVSLQAEYDLNTFVPNMKVEKLVTSVYQKAKNEKLDNYENAIYKAPTTKANATFSVNKEDYEMTLEEFDDYIRNTGDFAYKITNYLPSNYKWSSLSTAQQLYALEKTYEFSKAYWKKKLKPEYSAKSNWMDELCDNKVDFQTYARVIINQAEKYSPKD